MTQDTQDTRDTAGVSVRKMYVLELCWRDGLLSYAAVRERDNDGTVGDEFRQKCGGLRRLVRNFATERNAYAARDAAVKRYGHDPVMFREPDPAPTPKPKPTHVPRKPAPEDQPARLSLETDKERRIELLLDAKEKIRAMSRTVRDLGHRTDGGQRVSHYGEKPPADDRQARRGGRGKPWTDNETDTLLSLVERGRPYPQIADTLGRSVDAVEAKARQCGIRRRSYTPPVWNAELDARLRDLSGGDLTILDAAERLGLNYQVTYKRVRTLGLPFRRGSCIETKIRRGLPVGRPATMRPMVFQGGKEMPWNAVPKKDTDKTNTDTKGL